MPDLCVLTVAGFSSGDSQGGKAWCSVTQIRSNRSAREMRKFHADPSEHLPLLRAADCPQEAVLRSASEVEKKFTEAVTLVGCDHWKARGSPAHSFPSAA